MAKAETTLFESIVTLSSMVAAWIGCFLSIFVFRRDREHLKVESHLGDMISTQVKLSNDRMGKLEERQVCLRIINNGGRLTTAFKFEVIYFRSWFKRKPQEQPLLRLYAYEFQVAPGAIWNGRGFVPEELITKARAKGRLYCRVTYGANKTAKCRIKLDKGKN